MPLKSQVRDRLARLRATTRLRERSMRGGGLILQLGTMRSGSTLLTNILTTSPEIYGFGEAHLAYESPETLNALFLKTAWQTRRGPGRARFLLDKIVHKDYAPDLVPVARWAPLTVVMLLREPAPTLTSLTTLKLRVSRTPETRAAYLEAQLAWMQRAAEELPPEVPVHAVRYEALLADPDAVLARLTPALGLETPLSKEYDIAVKASGKRWLSDVSGKLSSRRIQPGRAPEKVEPVYAEVLARLERATERLIETVAARPAPRR